MSSSYAEKIKLTIAVDDGNRRPNTATAIALVQAIDDDHFANRNLNTRPSQRYDDADTDGKRYGHSAPPVPTSPEIDALHKHLYQKHFALYHRLDDVAQKKCCAWLLKVTDDRSLKTMRMLLKSYVERLARECNFDRLTFLLKNFYDVSTLAPCVLTAVHKWVCAGGNVSTVLDFHEGRKFRIFNNELRMV